MDEKKDRNEKLSLLVQLIKLAKADETIRDVEFQFLVTIASQLGVSNDEFKSLFDKFIQYKAPKLESDRILQFQRLVFLMNIDLEINEAEVRKIKDLGIRMGLRPQATDEVLKVMYNYPNKIVPPEVLISIFQTYNN